MPVATYSVHILGRGSGRSAVRQSAYGSGKTLRVSSALAAASYRSGEPLRDQQQEKTFDYSGREDVVHTEILAPDHAPEWAYNREVLHNTVEAAEKRKDAQLLRSLIIGLPRELTLEQNIELLREHVQEQFVARGMIADIAIHDKESSDGGRNPHAHVLLTLRDVTADGFDKKNRAWNHPGLVETWRNAWEQKQNEHLAAAGSDARVDMRSYERQGLDQAPTEHLGYDAGELEKQGIQTERGRKNEAIKTANAVRAGAREEPHIDAAANDNQRQAGRAAAERDDQREQAAREKPRTPADALRQQDRERQQQRGAWWGMMKDSLAGWQRHWDKQAERMQQHYAVLTSRETYAKLASMFSWGAKPQDPARQQEEEYRQKPRRVWSQEQREDFRKLQPYLQQQTDLTTRERAHAVAVHMQYLRQQREQERRDAMLRIEQQRVNARYRSIEQDRPIPTRERTRERGR
ncbi:MAG: hypothetical protein CL610_18850 [Anaerolineaceae bacterium]|nr:hypothetical protein [Anaerolineaceae bacterium]